MMTSADVLVGRGKGNYLSEGNVRLQKLVQGKYLEAYKRARNNTQKSNITQEIVTAIQQSGGRFLKEVEDEDEETLLAAKSIVFCEEGGRLLEVDDKQARIKVAQVSCGAMERLTC